MDALVALVAEILYRCRLEGGLVFDGHDWLVFRGHDWPAGVLPRSALVVIDLSRNTEGDVLWWATVTYQAKGFIDAGVED